MRVCLDRPLYPHQREMLEWARTRSTIALFCQMRLGKTPVTIRWARQDAAVLVVAPMSTLSRYGWSQELRLEHITRVHRLYDIPNKRRLAYMAEASFRGWYLINYEGLRVAPWLLELPWTTLILDESTKVRSPQAQITRLLVRQSRHIPRRAILTGLPNPESALDYFSQFHVLDGEFMGMTNYWQFRNALYHGVGFDWVPRRGTKERIKQEVHRRAFVLTRAQVGIGNEKQRQVRLIAAPTVLRTLQKQVIRDFAYEHLETKWSPVQAMWLAKLAGGFSPTNKLVTNVKLRELAELVTTELHGESVVVWFRFNHELHAATRLLTKKKVAIGVIYGATTKAERSTIQEAFQAGTIRVLLAQVKCGQYGMNLSRANTAVYYSNAWDHEVRAQSEDRIEHMRKHEPLLFIDLVMEGTADEAVLDALDMKAYTARAFSSRLTLNLKAVWQKGLHDTKTQHRTPAGSSGRTDRARRHPPQARTHVVHHVEAHRVRRRHRQEVDSRSAGQGHPRPEERRAE